MIEHVAATYESLGRDDATDFTFLVKREERQSFHTDDVLRLLLPGSDVLSVQVPTGGAACTALLAIKTMNNDDDLLICNGDVVVDADLAAIVEGFRERDLDGGIIVFDAVHPRWSYVRLDEDGLVIETSEKRPISRMATAGIYYFKHGRSFVSAAFDSIRKGADVGGSFYVCPVYNEMILAQKRIGVHEIPRAGYHSLADPQGVADYEKHLSDRGAE